MGVPPAFAGGGGRATRAQGAGWPLASRRFGFLAGRSPARKPPPPPAPYGKIQVWALGIRAY